MNLPPPSLSMPSSGKGSRWRMVCMFLKVDFCPLLGKTTGSEAVSRRQALYKEITQAYRFQREELTASTTSFMDFYKDSTESGRELTQKQHACIYKNVVSLNTSPIKVFS